MTTPAFESFLARVYTEAEFRQAFLAEPLQAAKAFGLSDGECADLVRIDRVGLELAAKTFAYKHARLDRTWRHPVRRILSVIRDRL